MAQKNLEVFLVRLTSITRSIQRLKTAGMEKYDLSAAHTVCLCCLLEHPEGMTQMALVRQMDMDKAQVSRVVRHLALRGYVRPMGATAYRGRYGLTVKGWEAAKEVAEQVGRIHRFVRASIPEEELAIFNRTLAAIDERLKYAVECYDGAALQPETKKKKADGAACADT